MSWQRAWPYTNPSASYCWTEHCNESSFWNCALCMRYCETLWILCSNTILGCHTTLSFSNQDPGAERVCHGITRVPCIAQVDSYKYLFWVPGNCASLRLAAQLLSDAAVLKLDSLEIEWYYPLLRPWVHYIPVRCFSGPHMLTICTAASGRFDLNRHPSHCIRHSLTDCVFFYQP